jgi:hypothetical protein
LTSKSINIVRAAFALYLVIALSVGDAGYWLFAAINLQAIKHEMSEMIREQFIQRQLCDITLANNSPGNGGVLWTEHGREFLFQNEMYDVVESVTKNDSTTYRCLKDSQENDFRFLVSRHASDDDISTPSIRFPGLKIFKDYTEHGVPNDFFSSTELYNPPYILFYQNPPSKRYTPPPKFS